MECVLRGINIHYGWNVTVVNLTIQVTKVSLHTQVFHVDFSVLGAMHNTPQSCCNATSVDCKRERQSS